MSQEASPRTIVFDEDDTNCTPSVEKSEASEGSHKWEGFGLKKKLMEGIYQQGFEGPSYIQKKAIPIIVEGKDLRAQAQSGTGKTATFVIGALQRIDENLHATQCLALVSTRDIAKQNAEKFEEIGSCMGVTVCLLAGGTPISADKEKLNRNPQIVVGTPGRINHMIEEGYLNTAEIKIFILDEADEMLKVEFVEQVKDIFCKIKAENFQTLLFSATYSKEDLELIKDIVEDPVEIDLRYEEHTLKGIRQFYVDIGPSMARGPSPAARDQEVILKAYTFVDIFRSQVISQAMVFINRKSHAALVHKTLNDNGFPCELISSELDQQQRNKTLKDFKSGITRILVSSGLCKRGIDVQTLSLVACLDVPRIEEKNDYIHRVGRSGRYGRKGIALHILTSQELDVLKKIAQHFDSVISPLPNGFNFKD